MQERLLILPKQAKDKAIETKKFFNKLKKRAPKNLDVQVVQIHEEVFEETSCMSCANCCKTTGPLFTSKDIDRISKHLNQKPVKFIDEYLKIDEDGDGLTDCLHADRSRCQPIDDNADGFADTCITDDPSDLAQTLASVSFYSNFNDGAPSREVDDDGDNAPAHKKPRRNKKLSSESKRRK